MNIHPPPFPFEAPILPSHMTSITTALFARSHISKYIFEMSSKTSSMGANDSCRSHINGVFSPSDTTNSKSLDEISSNSPVPSHLPTDEGSSATLCAQSPCTSHESFDSISLLPDQPAVDNDTSSSPQTITTEQGNQGFPEGARQGKAYAINYFCRGAKYIDQGNGQASIQFSGPSRPGTMYTALESNGEADVDRCTIILPNAGQPEYPAMITSFDIGRHTFGYGPKRGFVAWGGPELGDMSRDVDDFATVNAGHAVMYTDGPHAPNGTLWPECFIFPTR